MVRAGDANPGSQSLEVWRRAFELGPNDDGHQVAELLGKLRKELQATENALAAKEVPAHLYKYAANALQSMLTANNLSQPWGNVGAGAAQHHVIAFRWAAYILPDESHQVDTDDLNELKQLLADFESALADAILPPVLGAYLRDQLVAMKAAIATVVVSGLSDIRAAVRKAVADVHFSEDELKTEAGATDTEAVKDVRSKFGNLFKKSAEVAGDLDKFGKGAKILKDGVEWLMLQWDKLPNS
jgi:hypothetical protein